MHIARFLKKFQTSAVFCLLPFGVCTTSQAQTSSSAQVRTADGVLAANDVSSETPLPDSPDVSLAGRSSSAGDPQSAQPGAPAQPDVDAQPKRIFFIIPNYRSVNAGVHLPPQSPKEKFVTASQDTFDYSSLTLAALVAVQGYASNASPEFGSGGVGFGRYMWHSYVDQAVENYAVEFIVPVLTHEDTRFYTLGQGGFRKRATYALTRVFITRNDAGRETFNLSEVVGAGAAAGISNLYYPHGERTVRNTLDKYATNVGIDAASFMVREFDSDLYRMFGRKHSAPTTAP